MPKSLAKLLSCAVSLAAHLCALGAFAAWSLFAIVDSAKLGASPGVVTIEATLSEPQPELSPVEFAFAQEQVVITPHAATAMNRRFVETSSARVPLEHFLSRDVLDQLLSVDDEPVVASASMEKEAVEPLAIALEFQSQQHTARRASTRRPTTEKVEVKPVVVELPAPLPSDSGVRTGPSFAGNRPPSYPAAARRNGWEGQVMLRLFISASGDVTKVEVARSSGHAILDAEAVATVRTWHGQPATLNGRQVPTTELLPVRFRLR